MFRVTGEVVKIEVRQGTAKRTGNPYRFEIARVLQGRADMEDVTLPDDVHLRDGDMVDLACTVEVYNGNLNARVQGAWSDVVAVPAKSAAVKSA